MTISTSQETFEQIIAGEQNPTSAYMTGKLKIKGDMGAAMKLQKPLATPVPGTSLSPSRRQCVRTSGAWHLGQ